MERKIIKASSVEELLSILEKDYGPNWYEKITVEMMETPEQIEATIKPAEIVDPKTAFEKLSMLQIKSISLPDLSNIEQQYAQPIVKVNLSEDKMQATVLIIPGFERILPNVEEIKKALSDSKVVYGIDEKAIESIIEEKKIFAEVIVARGKNPIPSRDASVEFFFPPSGFVCEKHQQETFDPASFYKIFTCKKGDVLAIKKPVEYGQDGFTVTGEIIKTEKPKDINLATFVGENVQVSEDNTKIVATCDGQPYLKNSKIHVRNILVVDGDLGYETGNIDFNASVVIRGDAEGPFKINAGGDVLILGVLGEVQVNCGGSLRVQGGVFGRGKGVVKVAKDFAAKFVSEAQIFCGGNILVEEYIMNSTVICNGDVKVFGKGVISGGVIKAAGNIEAGEIGSPANLRTVVFAGIDYEYESKYTELQKSLIETMRRINLLSNTENSIRVQLMQVKDIQKRGSLKQLLEKIQTTKFAFEKQLQKIRNSLNILKLNIQVDKLKFGARVKIRKLCHPNVKVGIGLISKLNADEIGPCEFFLDRNSGKITYK